MFVSLHGITIRSSRMFIRPYYCRTFMSEVKKSYPKKQRKEKSLKSFSRYVQGKDRNTDSDPSLSGVSEYLLNYHLYHLTYLFL